MIIEIKCPKCEEIHYVDISIDFITKQKFKSGNAFYQYIIDNIRVKGVLPSDMVLENL
jgi:phage FluMu protein Com